MPHMTPNAARLAIAALLLAGAPALAEGPRPDPDAIREVRRAAAPPRRWASAAAIRSYLEARRRAREGDAAGAAEALRVAVAHDEESAELRVALAEALAESGRAGRAEEEARRAVELGQGGPAAAEANVLLARLALARGDGERAVLALREAIRLEGALAEGGERPDPTAWRLLADAYAEAGDEDAAARTLEDLAAKLPGDGAGFRERGRALLDRHEPARAERHLRRAVQLDPRDAAAHRLLAAAYDALGRARDAREEHLAVARLDPDDAPSLAALGRAAALDGDLERAREWFARYARASGGAVDAQVRVAFHWLEADQPAEALAVARSPAARPDPRLRLAEGAALVALRRPAEALAPLEAVPAGAGEAYVSARVALADALSRLGRHADAERALAPPLASRPADVRLLAMRAMVLERQGRGADAVAALREARDARARAGARAEAAELTAALAEALVRADRAREAVDELRAALAASPRDPGLLYALGAAYDGAGERDAAIAEMRALLALQPDHFEALNFVGYALAEQGVRLDEAERLVRRALELRPRSGHVLDSLGWVLFRRGDASRAVEVLERADALAGPEPVILEHLGDAYRALARRADAARVYRRALGAVPEDPRSDDTRRRTAIERKLRELSAGEALPPVSLTPAASRR